MAGQRAGRGATPAAEPGAAVEPPAEVAARTVVAAQRAGWLRRGTRQCPCPTAEAAAGTADAAPAQGAKLRRTGSRTRRTRCRGSACPHSLGMRGTLASDRRGRDGECVHRQPTGPGESSSACRSGQSISRAGTTARSLMTGQMTEAGSFARCDRMDGALVIGEGLDLDLVAGRLQGLSHGNRHGPHRVVTRDQFRFAGGACGDGLPL